MSKTTMNLDTQPSVQKRWLNPSELETEYGFSKSWQSKARMLKSDSSLPFSKIGKFVKYDRFAIDTWIEKHNVKGAI